MRFLMGRGAAISATAGALALFALPASAGAAVTPASFTHCGGSLSKDPSPTVDDPNLIDYQIHCDTDITAYTLIVNRRLWDFGTIDDFSSDISVNQTPGGAPSTTESVTCSADLPGDGLNCNAGAGGSITAWYNIGGSFDLVEPYCKTLPSGAKPGTPAIPQAVVQLVVTDNTGAEDGPFRFNLDKPCPAVPDKVPSPKLKKKVTKHKAIKKARPH